MTSALYGQSKVERHESLEVLGDSGYQGLTKLREKSKTPRQKPRKGELTDEQKQSDRELATRQLSIEHVIRSLQNLPHPARFPTLAKGITCPFRRPAPRTSPQAYHLPVVRK